MGDEALKITLAETAGFCFGVKRAVDLVYAECEQNQQVYTYGSIIHNEEVVKDLENKGAIENMMKLFYDTVTSAADLVNDYNDVFTIDRCNLKNQLAYIKKEYKKGYHGITATMSPLLMVMSIPERTSRSPKLFFRLITSITLSKAPFHQSNCKADNEYQHNINQCHNNIWNHKFITVGTNYVKCFIKVCSTYETYNRGFFNQ